jgi:hypothetical protein
MYELLKSIIEFQNINGRIYDLSFVLPSTEVPNLLLTFKNKACYRKIAQHYSGSLICLYDDSGNWTTDDYTICWVDANGEPNLPLSVSLKQFLSILPYGTGLLYDVLYLINKQLNKTKLSQYLNEDYSSKIWSEQLLTNKSHYKNHTLFIDFISSNGIELAKDPLTIIKVANNIK